MQLKLYHAVQENNYYFKGCAKMDEISTLFSEYSFSEESLEKAALHKKNMEQGISPFSVTLRMSPESQMEWSGEDKIFIGEFCEICNGASKIAAICQFDKEQLKDGIVIINLFLATKEKMKEIAG